MGSVVLDASALLAVINSEPGANVVLDAFESAMISSVNFAEVVTKLVENGAPPHEIPEKLAELDIPAASFDAGQAMITGFLRRETRRQGLSLADRACLALAKQEGVSVMTADKRWSLVDVGVEIRMIR